MNVTFRRGRVDDAQRCGQICFDAFTAIACQHNFPPDFPAPEVAIGLMNMMLGRGDVYSVIAEMDGRIVGSNFLWETSAIAGIGPITVDPSVQNGSIGRRLMEEALARVEQQRFAGVRLVQSAYHNRSLSLYTKLGFEAREPLSVMNGKHNGAPVLGVTVRPATEADVEHCNRLCLRIHGHQRETELRDGIAQMTAMVAERHGRITGYVTNLGFFGHAVGETNDDVKALIASTSQISGPGFLLPTRNAELLRWCLHSGYRVVQPLTLMSIGLYNEPSGAFLPSILY